MSRSTCRRGALFVLFALVGATRAGAADRYWANPLGGQFTEPANWSGATFPGPSDSAYFSLPDTYTVHFNADAANAQLFVDSGTTTFDLGEFQYDLTSTQPLTVGKTAGHQAELILRDGTVNALKRSAVIGGANPGTGVLRVSTGATLKTTLGRLTGAGFVVGGSGTGTLIVSDGGTVSSPDLDVALRSTGGAAGTVIVDGSGSSLYAGRFHIGTSAGSQGSLTVSNRGSTSTWICRIGWLASSRGVAIVEGPGSTFAATGGIWVGFSGDGSLGISNGGAVSVTQGDPEGYADLFLGVDQGATGSVTISDASSLTVEDHLVLAKPDGGTATFRVIGGLPQIQVGGGFQMGNPAATLSATIDDTGLSTIKVGGSAELLGTLQVALAAGFTPPPAEHFVVLSAGKGISGGLTLGGPDAGSFDLAIDAGRLILTSSAPELIWGGAGPGNWGSGPWTGGAPGALPDGRTRALVNHHTITVGAEESAFSLTVSSGAVTIAPTGTLTVADDVNVLPGAALDVLGTLRATDPIVTNDLNVDLGATLNVAGTVQADTLTTAGRNTFSSGAGVQVETLTFNSAATVGSGVSVHAGKQISINAPVILSSGVVVTAGTINVNAGATLTADTDLGSVATLRLNGGDVDCTTVLNSPVVEVFGGKLTTAGANLTDLRVKDGELNTSADVRAAGVMSFVGGKLTTSGMTTVSAASMDMTEATDINVTSGHLIVDLPSVGGIIGQRSIGVNFRSQWAETGLSPADSAGAFAQTNWNNTNGSSSGGNSNIIGPASGTLVDNSGTVVDGLAVAWSANTTWRTGNSGSGDNRLMDGYLDDTDSSGVTEVTLTGVPYAQYAVYAYVGSDEDDRKGKVKIAGREEFFYLTDSRGFGGFVQTTNTTGTDITDANYAVWTRLSGSDFTLVNQRISANVGLHGIQIVELLPVAKLGALTMGEDAELSYGTGLDAASFASIITGKSATIHGDVWVRDSLSPGNGPGTLTVDGNLTIQESLTYQWELGAASDLVAVTGDLTLYSWILLLKDAGGSVAPPDQLNLFTYTGRLDNLGSWTIDANLVSGNDRWNTAGVTIIHDIDGKRVYLTGLEVTPIPEPATAALLVLGGCVLLAYAWQKRATPLNRIAP